jgi:hypothetical protein
MNLGLVVAFSGEGINGNNDFVIKNSLKRMRTGIFKFLMMNKIDDISKAIA